jgi:hypothetical protein
VSAGDVAVGSASADPDGNFTTPLDTSSMGVGQQRITAECGPAATAALDVFLVNSVNTGTSTTTMIVFFLLIGVWLYAHRLAPQQSAGPVRDKG